jgi:hypothetical protein
MGRGSSRRGGSTVSGGGRRWELGSGEVVAQLGKQVSGGALAGPRGGAWRVWWRREGAGEGAHQWRLQWHTAEHYVLTRGGHDSFYRRLGALGVGSQVKSQHGEGMGTGTTRGGVRVWRVGELCVAPTRGLACVTHMETRLSARTTGHRPASACTYGGDRCDVSGTTPCALARSSTEIFLV